MRLPAPVVVAAILARELVRGLATPLHLAWFLVRRRTWSERATAALAAPGRADAGAWDLEVAVRDRAAPHVFVSAGEASGEMHAARLVTEVRGRAGSVRVSAFGGERLARAGATLLWPLAEHAVMGLRAVLASLPFFVRAVARFERLLREDRPDLVVLVDYPGLHLVLAEACRRHGVPVVHYVAPQYWAWGPWRMRRYARAFAGTLTILPFEPAWFAEFAIPSRYIGHPLLDQIAANPADPATVQELGRHPLLVLLPGSRTKEIRSHLPGLAHTARRLRERHPELRVVVVQQDPRKAALARTLLAGHAGITVHEGDPATHLAAARVVIAKSGTGSLEAVLRGAVTIVVYRVASAFAKALYGRLVVMPWFASANLIAGRKVVPEFGFAGDAGFAAVEAAADELLRDGPARAEVLAGIAAIRTRLGSGGATARAATCILQTLELHSEVR